MKVALLLTGHSRTYKKTIDNLKKHILDNYDVDMYFFTWNKTQPLTIDNKESVYENIDTKTLIGDYSSIGNLVKYEIGDIDHYKQNRFENIKFLDRENDVFKVNQSAIFHGSFWVERLRDQWYGVKKCFFLLENPFQYDCIIRMRFDIDLYNIQLKNLDFVIPQDIHGWDYSDHFAYGNPESMKKYCHLFDYIPSMYYNLNVDVTHATNMPKFYMARYGDNRVTANIDDSIKYTIVR